MSTRTRHKLHDLINHMVAAYAYPTTITAESVSFDYGLEDELCQKLEDLAPPGFAVTYVGKLYIEVAPERNPPL